MRRKIIDYVKKWEARGYEQGIPDEADSRLEAMGRVPSYRRICKAILSNDVALTSLGYAKPDCAAYGILKRVELAARKKAS